MKHVIHKTLFVGGLDHSITHKELKKLFSVHGTVEFVNIIQDKHLNQDLSFGFVRMSDGKEAQQCLESLNNTTVKGHQIMVRF